MAANQTTPMFHFLCKECGVSATIVDTPTGRRAWADHMRLHPEPGHFETWAWEVVPLDLEYALSDD